MAQASAKSGMLWGRLILALALVLVALSKPVVAQDLGLPDSAILVIDPSRLFAQSQFGQRIAGEIAAQGKTLSEDNRRIEAELAAEEKALTTERKDMAPEAFRDKADAFDAKVRKIRGEQEAKAVALAQEGDSAERRFLGVARPVLEELMVESEASVLLDTRAVLLSAGAVDVTDEAVRRINQVIGDGSTLNLPAAEPEPDRNPVQDNAQPSVPLQQD